MKIENIMTPGKTSSDDRREKNNMRCLEEGEEQYYHLLGEGNGISLGHCFYLGVKHNENFLKRVVAYKIIPNGKTAKMLEKVTGKNYISIQFFEFDLDKQPLF